MDQGILVLIGIALVVVLIFGALLKGERFTMVQSATGNVKNVKRGFSFTYLFFGSLVPLVRGHIGGFFLSFFINVFTLEIGRLIMCFFYNGMYINHLVSKGYVRQGGYGQNTVVINQTFEKTERPQPEPESIQPEPRKPLISQEDMDAAKSKSKEVMGAIGGAFSEGAAKLKDSVSNTVSSDEEPKQMTAKYRFCTNCGTKLNANAVFCTNCGQALR